MNDWRPWIPPPVKPRKRCFAKMRLWRDLYLARAGDGGYRPNHSQYPRRTRARGLRVWCSRRYKDARVNPEKLARLPG